MMCRRVFAIDHAKHKRRSNIQELIFANSPNSLESLTNPSGLRCYLCRRTVKGCISLISRNFAALLRCYLHFRWLAASAPAGPQGRHCQPGVPAPRGVALCAVFGSGDSTRRHLPATRARPSCSLAGWRGSPDPLRSSRGARHCCAPSDRPHGRSTADRFCVFAGSFCSACIETSGPPSRFSKRDGSNQKNQTNQRRTRQGGTKRIEQIRLNAQSPLYWRS